MKILFVCSHVTVRFMEYMCIKTNVVVLKGLGYMYIYTGEPIYPEKIQMTKELWEIFAFVKWIHNSGD